MCQLFCDFFLRKIINLSQHSVTIEQLFFIHSWVFIFPCLIQLVIGDTTSCVNRTQQNFNSSMERPLINNEVRNCTNGSRTQKRRSKGDVYVSATLNWIKFYVIHSTAHLKTTKATNTHSDFSRLFHVIFSFN